MAIMNLALPNLVPIPYFGRWKNWKDLNDWQYKERVDTECNFYRFEKKKESHCNQA